MDAMSETLKATGIQAELLGEDQRNAFVAKLRSGLGVDVSSWAPWNDANAPDGMQRGDGWELIPQFVGSSACLMFIAGARTIWRLNNGSDLLEVLNECSPLEFYVCDDDARYLLCSNHHDSLIGWGETLDWVDGLVHMPGI